MIQHRDKYRQFLLEARARNLRERNEDTPNKNTIGAYIGYLESVALWLDEEITPQLLRDKEAMLVVARRLQPEMPKTPASERHIRNYLSAMEWYRQMIVAKNLR